MMINMIFPTDPMISSRLLPLQCLCKESRSSTALTDMIALTQPTIHTLISFFHLGLCIIGCLNTAMAKQTSQVIVLDWHQAMQLAMKHHPDIRKALMDYESAQLKEKIESLHWTPTLSPGKIKHKIPFRSNQGGFWEGIDYTTKFDWTQRQLATQVSGSTSIGYASSTDIDSSFKLSLSQPLMGSAFLSNQLKQQEATQDRTTNARKFRESFYKSLQDTSKLYNDILKTRLQIKETQIKIQQSEQTIQQLQAEIKAGKKPQSDLPPKQLNMLSDKRSLLAKTQTLNEKEDELKIHLGLAQSTSLVITPNLTEKFEIPSRFNTAIIDPNPSASLSLNHELINLANHLVNESLSYRIKKRSLLPEISADVSIQFPRKTKTEYIGVGLVYPLDQREARANITRAKLSLTQEKLSLETNCRNIQNNLIESNRNLFEQAELIQLEIQKYNLLKIDIQSAEKAYEKGQISSHELSERSQAQLTSSMKIIKDIRSFFDTLNKDDILRNRFLSVNKLTPPESIQQVLALADSHQLKLGPITQNGQVNCNAISHFILSSYG